MSECVSEISCYKCLDGERNLGDNRKGGVFCELDLANLNVE